MGLGGVLTHPAVRGLDLDDPRTTEARRVLIRDKAFLKRVYAEWYASLVRALPEGPGDVLELGSGPGFLRELVPHLVTSEVFYCRHVRLVTDARALAVADGSLRGIVMTDVLHHVSEPRRFLSEAVRCLRKGGVVAMVEPWVTGWSRFVYRRLHHEPFEPDAARWEFPSTGPLSGANGALPWILFQRDRRTFESEFPGLQIASIEPMMPFRYLLSGGVSLRSLAPGWTFPLWRTLEDALRPFGLGMFARVVLQRV